MIASIAGFANLGDFRTTSFESDRNLLVSLLQHTRAEAMANVCRGNNCNKGRSHGVAIRPNNAPAKYVIFESENEEPNYSNRKPDLDLAFDADVTTMISGDISEVAFQNLSGLVADPGDIILTSPEGKSSTISITSEGQITWTH